MLQRLKSFFKEKDTRDETLPPEVQQKIDELERLATEYCNKLCEERKLYGPLQEEKQRQKEKHLREIRRAGDEWLA